MSIISDIAVAYGEVQKNLNALLGAPESALNAGSKVASGEARFFSRPMDSVARDAKKSILYFPVVTSETIGADTASIITKAVQVRAAEYVRLKITNLGPVQAAGVGKQAVIGALRGATLRDPVMLDKFTQASDSVVSERAGAGLAGYVDHSFAEDGLNPPMEAALITEAKVKKMHIGGGVHVANNPVATPNTMGGPPAARTGKQQGKQQMTVADTIAKIDELFGNGTVVGRLADLRGLSGEIADLVDEVEQEAQFDISQRDAATEDKVRDRLDRLADRVDRRLGDPTREERERRLRDVKDAIALANRGTMRGRAAAAAKIQEILATSDETGVAALRANAATGRILNMMALLPNGVVKDGSYDVSNTGNKAEVAGNVPFDKLNAFQPVLLTLEIRYQTDRGEPMDITDKIMVGVKGVAHPIPSMDLVTGLGTALQRDSVTLQFFRMTSGETSFLKDFVLNIGVAKARASARTTSGMKILETLRRQTEWNERRGTWLVAAVTKRGYVPPTTTMVITSDEVDRIRSIYGIDFSKPSAVRELLRSHNLMGFMIVDEAIGLVRVFEDGDDDFDRVPIATLKSQGKEASIKDIMTMMARK